jgi:GTP cyclohydrolase FolE2
MVMRMVMKKKWKTKEERKRKKTKEEYRGRQRLESEENGTCRSREVGIKRKRSTNCPHSLFNMSPQQSG